MKNYKRGFAPLVLIAIIAVVIAGGIYFFSQKEQVNETIVSNDTQATTMSEASTTTNQQSTAQKNQIVSKTQLTYSGQLYKFSYPSGWVAWEANEYLSFSILYPKTKEKELAAKTISTSDEISVSIEGGQPDSSLQKVVLNGQTWLVKKYDKPFDGGTENAIEYYQTITPYLYVAIASGKSNVATVEKVASSFILEPQLTTKSAVKVGQPFGFYAVSSVQTEGHNTTINYSAMGNIEVSITGGFTEGLGNQLCFEAKYFNWENVPRLGGDQRKPWFCFSNQEQARKIYQQNAGQIGSDNVIIKVRDYKQVMSESDATDLATLIAIGLY